MKFKVSKGTKLYEKFMVLRAKISLVNRESLELVESLGANKFCKKLNIAYGGIGAIQFEEKPRGWKMVGEQYDNLYYPKATEKELNIKFNALPTISFDEINELVKFHAPQTISTDGGLQWIDCIGLFWGNDCILISVTEGAKYEPIEDVVEILESEYKTLKVKADNN